MEDILHEIISGGFDISTFLTAALMFAAGSMLVGFLGRLLIGPDSPLANAVSSAIGILFIYIATVAVITIGGELEQFNQFLSPLPFVSIEGESLQLFIFQDSDHHTICQQLLSMVILSFLVNLLDTCLPRGEHLITWFFWRCTTVILAILAHWLVSNLTESLIPDVIAQNAPTILLGILILMLAVGALKFLVGAAIAMVNPIIGALYTFFFANLIGSQISKAVLSTALLTALILALTEFGITSLSISIVALTAYIPFLVILAVVWYVCNRIL